MLWCRQESGTAHDRHAQLVQPREHELHLGLHAGDAQDPAPGGLTGQEVQQRGLAHTSVTAYHQSLAVTTAHRVDQLHQLRLLGMPVHQLDRAAARPHA